MNNKILAAGSVALMGASSLLGASAAQAYTDEDCGDLNGMSFGFLLEEGGDVCAAIALGPGDFTFQAPAGTTAVEMIFVGAGGGAAQQASDGYGGNGGEILFIEGIDPSATFEFTLGAGGAAGGEVGNDGELSTLSIGQEEYEAHGGDGGEYFTGQSGGGNSYASRLTGSTQFGGGSKEPATADGPGAGWGIGEPGLVGDDNPLWIWEIGDSQYADGGNGEAIDGHNWGSGGDVEWNGTDWDIEDGQDGFAEIHYKLGATTPLASTGVDANAIGMTAGALGLGGVALAVVAAARRARRTK